MQGTSDSRLTNKTEFMRWLDAHPMENPALSSRYREYKTNFANGTKFGGWMRQKYLAHFAATYKNWWLTHPDLFGKVYEEQQDLSPLLARK